MVFMGMRYRQLNLVERSKIDAYLRLGMSLREIARELGRAPSTIMREIRRHTVMQLRDARYIGDYECTSAHRQAHVSASKKGAHLKIGRDMRTAAYLERRLREGFSPYAAIMCARRDGELGTEITPRTLYSYIYGQVLGVGAEVLVHGRRKKKATKEEFSRRRICGNAAKHPSIEERPKSVLSREEFGHWEAYTVVSSAGAKSVLLTMIERKTRYSIAVKLPDRRQQTIIEGFDYVEQLIGPDVFDKVFLSITFDNGVEFKDIDSIRYSRRKRRDRLREVYYCHPFCSSERGSNEVMHTFIRRRWPKGTDFGTVDAADIQKHMDWVNEYPRKIHGGRCAKDVFYEELRQIA